MLKAIRSLAFILLCLSLSGCIAAVGLGVGALGRSAGTGDKYSSWKSTMPNIPPNMGRLFVYMTERAHEMLNAMSRGTGGEQAFTVDNDVCEVLGEAFTYRDLPAGDHDVSADDVKKFLGGYRKGKYHVKVPIVAGGTAYVRIDKERQDGTHYIPRLVDAATAEAQIADLPIDTHLVTFECRANQAEERGTD